MIQQLRRNAKRFILKATGAMSHLSKDVNCPAIWYGNAYGGFYVNPTLLDKNSIVYSFGLGEDISFDKTVIEQHQCKVVGFDSHNNVDESRRVNVKMKSIEDILQETGHEKIDVLKIDIEGSEYEVILSLVELGFVIPQLLIEFHDRFYPNGRERTKTAIAQLKKADYQIFGVSASFEEVSFIHKSVLK